MAILDAYKVDLLYKKLFGVAKTDTSTNKSPSNEAISSPLINRGDKIYLQATSIPSTAAAVTNIVQAYQGASAIQTTADNTTTPVGSVYPTWKTGLTDWIPPEFGATYSVGAWVGPTGLSNPTTAGATKIFPDGEGGSNPGEYWFDYQAGVLNFIGGTIPPVLTSANTVYITGYRYVGQIGANYLIANTGPQVLSGNVAIANTTASVSNTTGALTVSGGLGVTGNVYIDSIYLTSNNIIANSVVVDGGAF